MKRIIIALAATLMAVAVVGSIAYAGQTETGNGAPSGAHYNLNIIGVENPKKYSDPTELLDPNGGKRIFVALNNTGGTSTKIMLKEGDIFDVLDYNGTDDGVASFQLPNPDENGDGTTDYSVFIRALGNPKGSAVMQSCYTDGTETWCAADITGGVAAVPLQHVTPSKFTNVSKDLLYVDVCTETALVDGVLTCTKSVVEPLFGTDGDEYWWDYANNGLRLAQLRFYDVETEAWNLTPQ